MTKKITAPQKEEKDKKWTMRKKFSSFMVTRGNQTRTDTGVSRDYGGLIEMACGSWRFKSKQKTKATHTLNTSSMFDMRRLFVPNLNPRKPSLLQIGQFVTR